jgi:hypothetical protein
MPFIKGGIAFNRKGIAFYRKGIAFYRKGIALEGWPIIKCFKAITQYGLLRGHIKNMPLKKP